MSNVKIIISNPAPVLVKIQPQANVKVDVRAVVAGGLPGEPGAPGAPGPSGQSYVHTQAVASAEWTINHNLGFYPNVMIVDSAGDAVAGDIDYSSGINTVILRFSAAFGGNAYLS